MQHWIVLGTLSALATVLMASYDPAFVCYPQRVNHNPNYEPYKPNNPPPPQVERYQSEREGAYYPQPPQVERYQSEREGAYNPQPPQVERYQREGEGTYNRYRPQRYRTSHGYHSKSKLVVRLESKEVKLEKRKEECEEKNAVYVDPNCYKLIIPELTFEDATVFCVNQGGQIWIPDFTDPFLYQNLARSFPAVFGASNNTLWVGATLVANRFITINGDDISNTYLGLIGDSDGEDGNCVFVELITGVLLQNMNCSSVSDFVCEFKLESKDKIVTKKHLKYI